MKTLDAKILDATHLELRQPLHGSPGGRVEILISDAGSSPAPRTTPVPTSAPSEQVPDRSSPGRPIQGKRLREREDAWCRSHPELLRRFAGQWLVVEGEEIVVHGRDPAQLVEQARAKGVRIPFVFYVETPRPGVVRMGL